MYYNNNEPDYHLLTRFKERTYYFTVEESDFETLISFILDELLENRENDYLNIEKQNYKLINNYYVKQWNVKFLDSDLFPAGMIQIDNGKIRFYVSTVLDIQTMKPKKNSIYFEIDI